jgi:hypothetical protein
MDSGNLAANLMEAASYPQGLTVITSQKKILLARQALHHALKARDPVQGERVHQAYRNNDAWVALTTAENGPARMDLLAIQSLLAATFPGVAMALALFGGLLWLLGVSVSRSTALQRTLQPPLAPMIGVAVALGIYFLTELPLAAITGVLCFAFLVFTPAHERTKPPEDLGPLFGFTMFLLGLAIFMSIGAFLIGISTPGAHMLTWLGVPRDYYNGSTLFLGLTGILLGLMLLAAPTWALIEHISTPLVVSMALKNLGQGLCAACLGLTVMAAPLAVYLDKQTDDTLQMLVENEPNYYLLQN